MRRSSCSLTSSDASPFISNPNPRSPLSRRCCHVLARGRGLFHDLTMQEERLMSLNASDYITSNLLKAENIALDVRIEAIITSVRPREFQDGSAKLILYVDYQSKGLVLNQTKLKVMIAAFGPSPAFRREGKKGSRTITITTIETVSNRDGRSPSEPSAPSADSLFSPLEAGSSDGLAHPEGTVSQTVSRDLLKTKETDRADSSDGEKPSLPNGGEDPHLDRMEI